jgi:hypothetical protein
MTKTKRERVYAHMPGEKEQFSLLKPLEGEFSILLSSPVYKQPHPRAWKSAEIAVQHLAEQGMQVIQHQSRGDAMVERARSSILAAYLAWPEGTFTHMVQFDDDIAYHHTALEAMIKHGKGVIGGAYTFKAGPEDPKHGIPVLRYYPKDVTEALKDPEIPHLIPVRYLGGGCTIVSDAVIRRLLRCYPELHYHTNPEIYGDEEPRSFFTSALWQSVMMPQEEWGDAEEYEGPKKEILSEDYAFCERIVTMHERDGGEPETCWLDPYVHLSHCVGDEEFHVEWFEEMVNERDGKTGTAVTDIEVTSEE